MLYQIQKYSTTDWNAQREVIDQCNFELESDAIAWMNTVVAGLDQTSIGFNYGLIPSTHEWFISDTKPPVVETASEQVSGENPVSPAVSDGRDISEQPDYQTVYQYERMMSAKLRNEKIQFEQKQREALAKLVE